MTATTALFILANLGVVLMLRRRLGVNLSLASVLLCFLLLFHGPAYLYYTRVYGPDTDFYDVILSSARGFDITPTLDIAMSFAFAFVSLGILFVDWITKTRVSAWRDAVARWNAAPMAVTQTSRFRILLAAFVLAIVFLIPFMAIDGQLPKVLEYFTADMSELEKIVLRREGGASGVYLYNLMLSNVIPFVAFALVAMALARVRGIGWAAAVFLVLVAIGKAATLSKAPLAVFALQCAIVWLLMRRLAMSWRAAASLGGIALVLFLVMAWAANPSASELGVILEFLFYRIFMIVNESVLEYFTAIPYAIPHSWGMQLSWLANLFQTEPHLPTFWLVGQVHRPEGLVDSTTTVMFLGDAWADFAWTGVVVVSFLAGAVVRWIDITLIARRGKNVATVAGISLGHYGVFIALSTSLQTALVTGGLAFIVPLVSMAWPRRRRRNAVAVVASGAVRSPLATPS